MAVMQIADESSKLANRYQFHSLVGQGGAGEVYAAWDDHLKRNVAIKRMKTKGIDDSVLANPWSEAIRLAAIHHSNIVTVYDMGQDDGVPYIVMEHVQGETVEDRVTRGVFSLEEFGELARQALDGLAAAHHAGLVHRDIKPSNIMLATQPSGSFQVKLLDFGMAKFLAAPSAQTMNIDGTITGSVCWISPEQVNREPVDGRCDLYSLGCVFYFALTGQRPFDGANAIEILTAHLSHNVAPLESLRADLPTLLVQWVMAMINLRPEHRYQSATEALNALSGILGYTQTLSIPVSPGMHTGRFVTPPVLPPNGATGGMPVHSMELSQPVPVQVPNPHPVFSLQPTAREASPPTRSITLNFQIPDLRSALIPFLVILIVVLGAVIVSLSANRPVPLPPAPASAIAAAASNEGAASVRQPTVAPSLSHVAPIAAATPIPRPPKEIAQGSAPSRTSALRPGLLESTPAPAAAKAPPTAPGSGTIMPAAIQTPAPVLAEVPALPAEVVFRVHGSNTIGAKLLPALMEEFLKNEGATRIVRKDGINSEDLSIEVKLPGKNGPCAVEIGAHGSKTAFDDLLAGKCDLGMASRPIKDEEALAIANANLGDLHKPACEHVLGLDGIAILVHKDNPVPNLTREQISRIFAGAITDWSQVGGPAGPIHLYSRDSKSGTFDTFKALVLDKAVLSGTAKLFEDSTALSDAVAADPVGIGFVGLPFVRDAKPLAVCDAGSFPLIATRFTVGTEDYILSRRLFLYSTAAPKNPWVRKFVDFALSDEGQEVVRKIGFVKQTPDAQGVPLPPEAPREYVDTIKDAKRLNLNFRFRPGSTQLDSKALRDLERIGNLLALPQYQGKNLLLLGFADNMGNLRINQRLSGERAQIIAHEFATRGIQPATVTGFGSILPVAGNDTAEGRDKNRRVEVWIR